MRTLRCLQQLSAGLLIAALPAFAAGKTNTRLHTHASVRHASGKKSTHGAAHSSAVAMPTERATEIQTALIKQGYLTGEPTGTWDAQSVAAMEKLQADNGWQSRITPDARGLIKLGLGPDQQHEASQSPPK
jgi:hypothetical protein